MVLVTFCLRNVDGFRLIFYLCSINVFDMENLTIEFKPVGLDLETNAEHFAVALKMWRKRMGLTQEQAAKRCGVSRWTIIKCEKAVEPSKWTMYRLFCRISQDGGWQ